MVGLRANPCLAAINDVMVEFGIPYNIERGGKHPRIVIEHNGRKKRIGFSGSPSDSFGPKKAAAETRRELRALFPERFEAGAETVQPSDFVALNENQIVFSTNDLHLMDSEPRILDLELGRRLGLSRPESIRDVIRSNANELSLYNNVLSHGRKTSDHGGRPGEAFYLTEPQAILITMRSNAPAAPIVRKALIDLYMQWRTQQAVPAIPALPAPVPELLTNEEAVRRIGEVVTLGVLTMLKPLLSDQMRWGKRRAERIEDAIDQARAQIIAVVAKTKPIAIPEVARSQTPARASVLDAYAWSGLSLPLPRQSSLGQKLRLSMEAYFLGSNIVTMMEPDRVGIMRRTYPYENLARWYDAKGKAIIDAHMACTNAKVVVSKSSNTEQCRLNL